jgi:DNA-binding MarR family transcriptional regulator
LSRFALARRRLAENNGGGGLESMTLEIRPLPALKLWQDVTLALVRDATPDLSARQMAILLAVYLEPPPHTVRGLAKQLNVTKPAITRALDSLGALDLLSRRRDDVDRRNVIVQRTVAGLAYIDRLSTLIIAAAQEIVP